MVHITRHALRIRTHNTTSGNSQALFFKIIGGQTTGTYAFRTGYYGLTTMPPEFQKIMDRILHETTNTFSFIDDILIVTKGSKEEHIRTEEAAINELKEMRPKNLKDPRSFMRAINQMNKFIPNPANLCAPLRPLSKKGME